MTTADEARGLTAKLGSVMVKAQVLWGRRGKENAVIACDNEEQLAAAVRSLLGRRLFSETVEKVLVEKKLDVAQEVYAAVTYVGRVADDDPFRPRRHRRGEGHPRDAGGRGHRADQRPSRPQRRPTRPSWCIGPGSTPPVPGRSTFW